jgi:hypothetical protein
MNPIRFQWVLILMSGITAAQAAAGPPHEPRRFAREVRVAYDLSRIDLARVGQAHENWAILRVSADPWVGAEEIAAGRLPNPNEPDELVDWAGGTATRIATLSGFVEDDRWQCLVQVPKHILFGTRPIYMNDEAPGPCVCRVEPDRTGRGWPMLKHVRLIPESWVNHAAAGLTYWHEHSDLLTDPKDPQHRKGLIALSGNENPMLAYLACRAAADGGGLAAHEIAPRDLDALDERGMMLEYLLLHRPAPASVEETARQLTARIAAATSPDKLYGIATACALDLATPTGPGMPGESSSYRLLGQIELRAAELTKGHEPDPYLTDALQELYAIRHLVEFRQRLKARHP